MLLFQPEHVAMILGGRKTVTRRAWKKQRVNVGSIQLAKISLLSKDYFAKLRITEVKKEKLRGISQADVFNEGYNSLAEYMAVWERINKTTWDPDQEVWVVRFEVVN